MSRDFFSPALTAAALVAMMASAPAIAADYVQAPGSTLVFASKYDGEVFTGKFASFATTLSFDPAKLAASKLDVVIPLAGASTGNADRDGTLSGSDFFDVARFAQARYTATRFRSLGGDQYAADGTLEIDNLTAERALRGIAVGRKNWNVIGSDAAGKVAAVIYSLVETCRLNGINPEAYLTDVIDRIGRTKIQALDTLLPFNWRPPDAGNPADPGRMNIAPHTAAAA